MDTKNGRPDRFAARKNAALAHLASLALALGLFACKEPAPDPNGSQISAADRAAIAVAAAKISMCEGNDNGTAIVYYDGYLKELSGAEAPEPPSGAREEAMRSELECLGSASSCDDVWRCRGGLPEQTCDPSDFPEHDCDGDFVVVCAEFDHPDDPFIWRIEDCSLNESGATHCIDGQCAVSSCDDETTADSCESEGAYQICSDGVLSAGNCGPFEVCVEHPDDGQTSCEFDVPCEGPSYCDGSTVVECYEGRVYGRTVCSRMGYECVESTYGEESYTECGISAESAHCDGGDSHCDGAVISYCDYGLLVEIDCGVLEGGTCADLDGPDGWNSGLSCVLQD